MKYKVYIHYTVQEFGVRFFFFMLLKEVIKIYLITYSEKNNIVKYCRNLK